MGWLPCQLRGNLTPKLSIRVDVYRLYMRTWVRSKFGIKSKCELTQAFEATEDFAEGILRLSTRKSTGLLQLLPLTVVRNHFGQARMSDWKILSAPVASVHIQGVWMNRLACSAAT